MSRTLAARVAWAAVISACVSSTIAAVASSAIANALLSRNTDLHLVAGATELARELETGPRDGAQIEESIREEQAEATSRGITFAVYTREGKLLGGDAAISWLAEGCESRGRLRICRVTAHDELSIVAATIHDSGFGLFAVATLTAAVLASLAAWSIGRRLMRRATLPLSRLHDRIAALRLEQSAASTSATTELGPDEGVREVDELRAAMTTALRRMHEALDRATRFSADAAHELRTPLTVLRTDLELLAEEDGDDRVGRAVRKVEQLQALTERLLILAMPDARVTTPGAMVSLRDVVDEILAELAPDDARRVTFSGEYDVLVQIDEAELGIVVSNGLSNALKFGTHVVVEIVADGSRAALAIDDDGPGVDPAQREAVFAPFTRGTSAQGVPGHGLGLALVAHVAKRHGGEARLVASARHGRGARLEIELPLGVHASSQ